MKPSLWCTRARKDIESVEGIITTAQGGINLTTSDRPWCGNCVSVAVRRAQEVNTQHQKLEQENKDLKEKYYKALEMACGLNNPETNVNENKFWLLDYCPRCRRY